MKRDSSVRIRKSRDGEDYVRLCLVKKLKFSRLTKSDRNGSDLIGYKQGRKYAVEVKTSDHIDGIPDMFGTEFTTRKPYSMVADFLVVLRTKKERPIRIDVLTRKEVDEYAKLHRTKRIIKVASRLKTDLKNGRVGKKINL